MVIVLNIQEKVTLNYQWALHCALDKSFTFLLNKNIKIPQKKNNLFYSFLAGYADAEGCWAITRSYKVQVYFRFLLCTGDFGILKQIKEQLEINGYHPSFRQIIIKIKNNYKSQKLKHTKELYELGIHRKEEVISLIKNMPHYLGTKRKPIKCV